MKEYKDKINQLIETNDLTNWNLGFQLLTSTFDTVREAQKVFERFVIKHIESSLPRTPYEFEVTACDFYLENTNLTAGKKLRGLIDGRMFISARTGLNIRDVTRCGSIVLNM